MKVNFKLLTQHPQLPKVRIVRAVVPYLAGSSNDMRTVYIDPSLNRTLNVNGKRLDPAGPLAVHELVERQAIEIILQLIQQHKFDVKKHGEDAVHQEVYDIAHKAGTEAEENFLRQRHGFSTDDISRYQELMHEAARKTEKQSLTNAPPDLYKYMYPQSEVMQSSYQHGHGKLTKG